MLKAGITVSVRETPNTAISFRRGLGTGRLDLVLLPLLLGFVVLAVYRYRLMRGKTR